MTDAEMMRIEMHSIAKELQYREDEINSGHYLQRMIVLCEIFELTEYEYLLRANQVYLDKICKPAGLDELLSGVGNSIMWKAELLELTDNELTPLAWAIPWDVLKYHDKLHLRQAGSIEQRENV